MYPVMICEHHKHNNIKIIPYIEFNNNNFNNNKELFLNKN